MGERPRLLIEEFWQSFRIADALDIALISIVVYTILVWFRTTASRSVAIGVSLLAAFYFAARLFDLYLTSLAFQTAFAALLVGLVGLETTDGEAELEKAVRRISTLRIFEDEKGRMNVGLDEIGGAVLLVSQFTLAGSIRKGRRPSFDRAMKGDRAEPLFARFVELLQEQGIEVATGVFGATMEVELTNEGPVTLLWNSQS